MALLKDAGRVECLVAGADFACGSGLDTNAAAAKSFLEGRGATVEIVPPVVRDGVVSSSRIRRHILEGDFSSAAELLGRPFEVDVRALAFRSADGKGGIEKSEIGQLVPSPGRYSVLFAEAGGGNGGAKTRFFRDGTCVVTESRIEFAMSEGARIDAIVFHRIWNEKEM